MNNLSILTITYYVAKFSILVVILMLFMGNALSKQNPFADHQTKQLIIDRDSIFADARALIYSQPDSAHKIIQFIRKHDGERPDSLWNIRTLNLLGVIKDVQSVYDSALYYYYQAYTAAAELENHEQLGNTSNNIGLTHWHTGNYKDALDHFFNALDHYDKADLLETRGNIHNNIGLIYAGLDNFKKAWEHYNLAYSNYFQEDNLHGIGAVLTNKGLLKLTQEQPDSAMHFMEQSIAYKQDSGDDYGLCISLESKGRIQFSQNAIDSAIASFEESLELAESLGYSHGIVRAKRGLATVYLEKGTYEIALDLAGQALASAEEIDNKKLTYQVHETISEIHEASGNFNQSLAHYKAATTLRNQSINTSRLHQVYDLEIQRTSKKNLQEIEQLNQEKEIQQLHLDQKDIELRRKNTMIVLIIVVFVFILTGGYFVYNSYRHRQQANLQKAYLRNKEYRSRAAIEAELQERKRIGQELHDGLGQMLSVMRLNIGVLKRKKTLDPEKQTELYNATIQTVDRAFREVRNISHNLAPAILSEMSLEQAVKSLTKQINQSNQVTVDLETMGLDNIHDNIIETTIYRAVQELTNNALKHSMADQLFIQVISDKHQASVLVEDNGQGFDIHTYHHGTGLKNIQTRIENLNGTLHMDTRENRGSIIQIFIPINNTIHEREINKLNGSR